MRLQVERPNGQRSFHETERYTVRDGELVMYIDNLTTATYAEGMWTGFRVMPR